MPFYSPGVSALLSSVRATV